MFFNLAWRNSKRSRNENLIYFLTMVTAVAAFYIVLSLGAQDVIRFLSSLENHRRILFTDFFSQSLQTFYLLSMFVHYYLYFSL